MYFGMAMIEIRNYATRKGIIAPCSQKKKNPYLNIECYFLHDINSFRKSFGDFLHAVEVLHRFFNIPVLLQKFELTCPIKENLITLDRNFFSDSEINPHCLLFCSDKPKYRVDKLSEVVLHCFNFSLQSLPGL